MVPRHESFGESRPARRAFNTEQEPSETRWVLSRFRGRMGNHDLGPQEGASPSVAGLLSRHGSRCPSFLDIVPFWSFVFFQGLVTKNDFELLVFLLLLPSAGISAIQCITTPTSVVQALQTTVGSPVGLWLAWQCGFHYLGLSLGFPLPSFALAPIAPSWLDPVTLPKVPRGADL